MRCSARVYGSESHCSRCGYVWDNNDPDPPACKSADDIYRERQHIKNQEFIADLKARLHKDEVPKHE